MASEELSVFIASLSLFPRSMVNGRHLSHQKNRLTTEVSVTELILRKFPSSPETPGELGNFHKKSIYQKYLGSHTCTNSVYQALLPTFRAPGNEAISLVNLHVHEIVLISCEHAQWHCIVGMFHTRFVSQ